MDKDNPEYKDNSILIQEIKLLKEKYKDTKLPDLRKICVEKGIQHKNIRKNEMIQAILTHDGY